MNHRMEQNMYYLFHFFIFLSILPYTHCQRNEKCRQPFHCGGIRNISYPFWGSNRPEICGFPGFELLNCQFDAPLLNIDSRSYRVLEIDFVSQTLRVARQDLWNTTCPSVLHSTTLDSKLFEFPSVDSYENVSLYYDCKSKTDPVQAINLQNQFTCDVDRAKTVNLFAPGEPSGLGSNIICSNNISVPVSLSAARALSAPLASKNDLRDALAGGFSVQWLDKINNCESCLESGGVCGYDPDSWSVKCNNTKSTVAVVSGARPTSLSNLDQRQTIRASLPPSPGLAPAESPGPSPNHTRHHGKSGLSIVEKVLIGMVIFVATCLVICRTKHHIKRFLTGLCRETNPKVENFLLNNESLAPKRYKYSDIKKITESFSDKLGEGGYGSVYKGRLPDGQFVAVKLLTKTESDGEDFINEVASISKTSHINIVNLLGFCSERNKRALVYEFMPNKSLEKFIRNNGSINTGCQLNWETLYKIAVGVARGLEYLHKGCNTRIIHFDIKPQNILLDEEFCPKISDFGLAKLFKRKQSILSTLGARGTVGYIAPEVFSRNYGVVSHKSDVYSYGMMVLEMVGARNFVGLETSQASENICSDKFYEHVILQESMDDSKMSEEEDEAARKMFLVGFWCIQTIPSDRPSMSKVVEMLEGSLQYIQIPPKPYLFNPPVLGPGFSSISGNVDTG
ncbi:LEAF RUST 10 DISEASE-RESISTANCE LOCUS RECEPTOR-LIKE PROTEIN KINASE-like 2.4 isoform X1 [Primulina tabacum]|uniref:LEAF RUST 10 DISEASE-RESISTANCE LOCUS RECEPTOR-LIKE PROTEIN KINASE-like 2.4 isoform X1 n=1 Tax=Primulina tabacum TaxID=48773 RepID=UPI003F5ABDC7